MRHYCDSNFVISYLLADNPETYLKTKEVFNQVQTGKTSLVLEQTVFTEIVIVLSSFYKAPKAKIAEVLSKLLAYKGIICEHKEKLLLALNLYTDHDLHIIDCLIAAKTEDINNSTIFSFNQNLVDILTDKNNESTK